MVMVMGMVKLLMLLLLVQPIWPIRQRHLTHVSFALKWRNTAAVVHSRALWSTECSTSTIIIRTHTIYPEYSPDSVCAQHSMRGRGKGREWPQLTRVQKVRRKRQEEKGEKEKEIVLIREIFSSSAHRHTWCTSNAGDGVDAVAVV